MRCLGGAWVVRPQAQGRRVVRMRCLGGAWVLRPQAQGRRVVPIRCLGGAWVLRPQALGRRVSQELSAGHSESTGGIQRERRLADWPSEACAARSRPCRRFRGCAVQESWSGVQSKGCWMRTPTCWSWRNQGMGKRLGAVSGAAGASHRGCHRGCTWGIRRGQGASLAVAGWHRALLHRMRSRSGISSAGLAGGCRTHSHWAQDPCMRHLSSGCRPHRGRRRHRQDLCALGRPHQLCHRQGQRRRVKTKKK